MPRAFGALLGRWQASLQLRVVTSTVALGLFAISILGAYLFNQIASGLREDRVVTAQAESRLLAERAQAFFDDTDRTQNAESLNYFANATVVQQLAPPATDPNRYVVFTRALGNTNPVILDTVLTGGLTTSPVPMALRQAVGADVTRQQAMIIDLPRPEASVAAVVVGSQVQVPTAGGYDLYFVYPMDREQVTLALIRRLFAFGGLALVSLVGAIAWVVTRQVVRPVRRAADVAHRLSTGHLNERMDVVGRDDLALLASSFNDMAEHLQSQIRQLEDLSRLQQVFVSDVSHELRTPLTTIRMAADVIHDRRATFALDLGRSAELLNTELDRFEELLADLLEISRFDAGAANLEADPTDLRAVVARVVVALAPLAAARGSALVVDAPSQPVVAEIDARRVERILRNLVVNAVEHGEGNPVVLAIAQNKAAVAVAVRDRGVGLRQGDAELVFNRFWRADPARARTTGGTGLGLAISLADARLHHGWLEAWGEPGRGSVFRLTLPRTTSTAIHTSPLPLEPPPEPAVEPRASRAPSGANAGDASADLDDQPTMKLRPPTRSRTP